MKPTSNYYDLLEVSPHADLVEISTAYLRIARELAPENSPLPAAEADFRRQLVKQAYEVLSQPSRRADYDAGLRRRSGSAAFPAAPMQVEVALERSSASPIRRLLTVIAAVMVIGLAMQLTVMFMAYQRTKAVMGDEGGTSPAAEKVYLQDFYQTYGVRAASRAEAELLLADIRRKEEAARQDKNRERLQEEQERSQRQFEEESRRLGAEVSANLRRAEQDAERAKAEAERLKEEKIMAEKEAERQRRENEINRFRSRPVQADE